jgi:retinol dehydrogenase-12
MNRISPLLNIVFYAFYPFWWVGSKTPVEGAQTTIFCAVDDSVPSSSGKYFSDCQVKEPTRDAQDCEAAKRLWDISVDLVKL